MIPNGNIILKSKEHYDLFEIKFHQLFTVVFEYLMMNFKLYDSIILNRIEEVINSSGFDSYLIISYLITRNVTNKKFYDSNQDINYTKCGNSSNSINTNISNYATETINYDFNIFYPSFNENFIPSFFPKFKTKIISVLNDLLYFNEYTNKEMEFNHNHNHNEIENDSHNDKALFTNKLNETIYFPPYLINLTNLSMIDFIVHHSLASLINDNLIEIVSRNFWIKEVIECFCFCDFLQKVYKLTIDYLVNNGHIVNNDTKRKYYFKIKGTL